MPWLSRKEYNRLLRSANERLAKSAHNEYKNGISDLEFLLWRLDPSHPRDGGVWRQPFEWIDVYVCDDKVFIFIVHDDKPLMLEDSRALYPSDELVAKLRFLLK